MQDNDLNEPAFPILGACAEHQFCGMTLRDYFAAHAPDKIPDWFKGEYAADMPIEPVVPSSWSAAQSAEFSDLKEGMLLAAVSPEVADFYGTWKLAHEQRAAWRDRQRARKYFSWRWHYADMMLKERAK